MFAAKLAATGQPGAAFQLQVRMSSSLWGWLSLLSHQQCVYRAPWFPEVKRLAPAPASGVSPGFSPGPPGRMCQLIPRASTQYVAAHRCACGCTVPVDGALLTTRRHGNYRNLQRHSAAAKDSNSFCSPANPAGGQAADSAVVQGSQVYLSVLPATGVLGGSHPKAICGHNTGMCQRQDQCERGVCW